MQCFFRAPGGEGVDVMCEMSIFARMYQSLHCIALRRVRYADGRSILSAWSAEAGRVAFAVSDGAGREAARKRALLMPLSLFECVADTRPGRDVAVMRDLRPMAVAAGIAADPVKGLVAMFVAEALDRVLRESAPDAALTEFIFGSVRELDSSRRRYMAANFPIVFLYHLGRYLGIAPDAGAWRPGRWFDMASGRFADSTPLCDSDSILAPVEAALIPALDRLTAAKAARLPLPRALRRRALEAILRYYSLHHTPMDSLRSLAVVSDVF